MALTSGMKVELGVRLFLFIVFCVTDKAPGFHRKIQPEEWWLYKNPRTSSYVPSKALWFIVIGTPIFVIWGISYLRNEAEDRIQGLLGASLSVTLAGDVVNLVKLVVGRPRPDFFYRCWPDGIMDAANQCNGSIKDITDGYKSFPSGHSALSFSSLAFVSFYLMGKLHLFSHGRGEGWRVCAAFTPLFMALMIALSRTADYHHHWQDVLVGSLVGLSIAYLCYRQYYPSLSKGNCHRPLSTMTPHEISSPKPREKLAIMEV